MPLAPEIASLMPGINARPPMHRQPLATLRQTRDRIDPSGHQPVGEVRDLQIPVAGDCVKARFYSPDHSPAALPLVMVMHGGGFVFGDLEGYYDHLCRVLCAKAQCRVLSVNYRLAPEHKFPAATDDVHAALCWAHENAAGLGIDPARMFIAGGSAGANLATSTALRVRDQGGPPLRGQMLFYPFVDWHTPASDSLSLFAEGYYLTRADVHWFWQQYLPAESDRHNPYAVPLAAPSLADMPAALVVTAQFDPLRDGAERYARRMASAGVPVQQTRYDGMVHGFLAFPTPKADEALQEAADWLRARF